MISNSLAHCHLERSEGSPPHGWRICAMIKYFILFFLFSFLNIGYAAEDSYLFYSVREKQRFESLTSQLRCLVCQNQTLADSNAPLANDLRKQVYQKILHDQSDQQIIDYLVSRYGHFILYRPPINSLTLGLWMGPFILLVLGLSYLFFYIKKRRVPPP